MSVAIGIDLGTTNTVVAAVVDGVAVTLEDEKGRRLLPSIVSFQPNGKILVGEAAREKRVIDPENTVYSVKPLYGRGWDSPEAQAARQRFPFKLVEGARNATMVEARGTAYALPEVSAFVLRRAKAIAEAALNQPVDKAVITVPANFNDLQRASTKLAGKLAGLDVMRILNEPTAAALAYGQSIKQAEKIAIYDLGGGTFDVTLLDLTNSVFEVLATAGDTSLGGDDVDRIIVDKILAEVQAKLRVDSRGSPQAIAQISSRAEEIKKHLSTNERFEDELTGVAFKSNGRTALSLPFTMTRAELEQLARPLLERTVAVAQQSITSVGLTVADFERVILVGGATRMPLVARVVESLFGKPAHLKVNPDEVVALGAAIQAHALNRAKSAHKQVVKGAARPPPVPRSSNPKLVAGGKPPPLPKRAEKPKAEEEHPAQSGMMSFSKGPAMISWELPGDAAKKPPPPAPPVIVAPPRPARPPIDELDVPDLDLGSSSPVVGPTDIVAAPPELDDFGLDLPMDSHPYPPQHDHAPPPPSSQDAFGEVDLAASFTPERFQQGSAIATSAATPLLIDVTPLSLGVETAGGYADVLIPSNSPVPCEKTRTFLTANDGQTSVTVRVAQGESPKFAANTRLGDVDLTGLRAAYRGEVKIAVTFELDADGILNVRARDPDTGRETVATMRLVGAASQAEDIVSMTERQAQYTVQ